VIILQKFIIFSSITLVAAQNHTHTDSVTSETQSNMVPSLQIFFPHASTDYWLRQIGCNLHPTIRCYGLQHTIFDEITPNDDGNQNFGGLFSLQYLCNLLWQTHSASNLRDNTFNVEEVRIMYFCKLYIYFLRI